MTRLQYELRADTVSECKAWIDAIKMARWHYLITFPNVNKSNIEGGLSCEYITISYIIFSFNKLLLQKEELEQKHLHLLQVWFLFGFWWNCLQCPWFMMMMIIIIITIINQVVESEKTAKWQYTRHCEELGTEIKKLREEVAVHKSHSLLNW